MQDRPAIFPAVSEELLQDIVWQILAEEGPCRPACGFDTRLDDLTLDSLQLAELIALLEDALGVMLEFNPGSALITLGDVCRSLEPIEGQVEN